jgi:hypothetical protein
MASRRPAALIRLRMTTAVRSPRISAQAAAPASTRRMERDKASNVSFDI